MLRFLFVFLAFSRFIDGTQTLRLPAVRFVCILVLCVKIRGI